MIFGIWGDFRDGRGDANSRVAGRVFDERLREIMRVCERFGVEVVGGWVAVGW